MEHERIIQIYEYLCRFTDESKAEYHGMDETCQTLKVKRFLLDDMLEQFGEYAGVREQSEDNEYITICARIGISDSFYRWVMKYGDNIEILLPKDIRQCFVEKIQEVFEKYQK